MYHMNRATGAAIVVDRAFALVLAVAVVVGCDASPVDSDGADDTGGRFGGVNVGGRGGGGGAAINQVPHDDAGIGADVGHADAHELDATTSDLLVDAPSDLLPTNDGTTDAPTPVAGDDAGCGAVGGPCCVGAPACAAGGCCAGKAGEVTGICVASGQTCTTAGGNNGGVCTDGACSGCGQLNQTCCAGRICSAAGTSCPAEGICRSCGNAGEACCPGTSKCNDAALECTAGTCRPCGGPKESCCPGDKCNAPNCCLGSGDSAMCGAEAATCQTSAGQNGGTCQGGKCSACGGPGQACCAGNVCYQAGETCLSNKCTPCGGLNQPACRGNLCASADCLNEDQVCVAAGTGCGPAAGTCTVGGACVAGAMTCGGPGQACCMGHGAGPQHFCSAMGLACVDAGGAQRCRPCGALGQPCCSGSFCGTGTCKGEGDNRACR
jgi:hypothetical protein